MKKTTHNSISRKARLTFLLSTIQKRTTLLTILTLFFCGLITQVHAQDYDGDGVLDAADLDDDNDGILDSIEFYEVALVNGGFETSSATVNGNNYPATIPPWVKATNIINVIRVDGTAQGSPGNLYNPDNDAEPLNGRTYQYYVDLIPSTTGAASAIYQTFTIKSPTRIAYSGYFSTRNTNNKLGAIAIFQGTGNGGTKMAEVSDYFSLVGGGKCLGENRRHGGVDNCRYIYVLGTVSRRDEWR